MFIVLLKKIAAFLKKENIPLLTAYIVVITIITSSVFYYFERGINKNIKDFYDSLWWAIVTFTTVGYGDIYPETGGGRVIAVIAMLLGIGFIGTFMATIASIIIQAKGKELTGMKKVNLKNHLIICGYNKLKVENFIKEFRSDSQFNDIPIVLITNSLETHPMPDTENVYFVKGESTDEAILEQAAIHNATRVIVMAESNLDTTADEKTILTVMLVEELNPNIYTCAEILSPRKKGLLKRAHCDEVITLSEISVNLMVQAIQDPGITKVIGELTSNTYGHQFNKSKVKQSFFQKTFYDLSVESLNKEHIVVAIERNGEYMVNPVNSFVLQKGDAYFYISKERMK